MGQAIKIPTIEGRVLQLDDFTTNWILSAGYACDSILPGEKNSYYAAGWSRSRHIYHGRCNMTIEPSSFTAKFSNIVQPLMASIRSNVSQSFEMLCEMNN